MTKPTETQKRERGDSGDSGSLRAARGPQPRPGTYLRPAGQLRGALPEGRTLGPARCGADAQ